MAVPPPPPPPPPRNNERAPRTRGDRYPRWLWWVVIGVLVAIFVVSIAAPSDNRDKIAYGSLLENVNAGKVSKIRVNNSNGHITGELKDGTKFTTTGPLDLSDSDKSLLVANVPTTEFYTPQASLFWTIIPYLLPILLLILFFVWLQRRQQGQMGNIMSIGRSRARAYTTERPKTTFSDVAGYAGVKQEVREVVDFLRFPDRFSQIGARTPKGILLVGPPGTGKTLIARAVAGEAGVPFLSVTGSDFMEMFVGVGASRVRDLFDTARKLGRAIIFIDEIDSIGRKRGAGLGGGHDEREQTLNQMLSEMDGFEASEGIVMMAATNRPDILDPALLRPGRFDRQVVVPLPELEDRVEILRVHTKGKRMASDVDVRLIARGTPGMSGADLANLVNEAALFAVRAGDDQVGMRHFDAARDRVLMGQRRESLVLSEREKQLTAYHEAGHAVCATLLPTADPIHKVTILPMGMALGVTQQLPTEDRHSYDQTYLEERLIVFMGGRMAEQLVFGVVSTGANNDLVSATELGRKMVREWGMSQRIGPMAWGSQGMVFLGEDLMHTRDYSDETAHVIDEEVEKVLREMEDRCRELLLEHRRGLDLVARALLEHETIDGAEVQRLIEIGMGTGSADPSPSEGPTPLEPPARPTSNLPAPPMPPSPVPLPEQSAPSDRPAAAPGVPLRFDEPLQP